MIVTDGTLAISPPVIWANMPIRLDVEADPAYLTAALYYVEVKVRVGSPSATPFATFLLSPDNTGNMEVFLQAYVSAWLERNYYLIPPASAPQVWPIPVFHVELTEVIDATSSTDTRQFPAILAGAPEDNYAQAVTWLSGIRHFLCTSSSPKPSRRDVPEFLYWLSDASVSAYRVRVRLYRTDGTTAELHPYFFSTPDVSVVAIPVGFEVLGLDAYDVADAEITRYEVCIATDDSGGDSNRISEWFGFELDVPCIERDVFLFRNSLGGYEVLVASGTVINRIESEAATTLRDRGNPDIFTRGELFVVEQQNRRGGEGATDWLPIAYARTLQDFVISAERYIQTEAGWRPIVSESTSLDYRNTASDLIGLNFSYVFANQTRSFGELRT